MAKKYLSKGEEDIATEELKSLVSVYSVPQMIREAIRRNKWKPEEYSLMIDDELYPLEPSLKRYENNEPTELDIRIIRQVLEVPKIKRRIDRDFGGVVSKAVTERNRELRKGISLENKLKNLETNLEKVEKKEERGEKVNVRDTRPRTISFDERED